MGLLIYLCFAQNGDRLHHEKKVKIVFIQSILKDNKIQNNLTNI